MKDASEQTAVREFDGSHALLVVLLRKYGTLKYYAASNRCCYLKQKSTMHSCVFCDEILKSLKAVWQGRFRRVWRRAVSKLGGG